MKNIHYILLPNNIPYILILTLLYLLIIFLYSILKFDISPIPFLFTNIFVLIYIYYISFSFLSLISYSFIFFSLMSSKLPFLSSFFTQNLSPIPFPAAYSSLLTLYISIIHVPTVLPHILHFLLSSSFRYHLTYCSLN